ncbi:MAG: undecaprenyldiphospho-muramoylpentapeptide beta-N-acetylglucosaminyltransferase [Chlorobi bacterium]|nr:undecaprenyldiphospho-muramoylpentapeptide beta-N-acetylglucosaminyltransferase [Chlorobiota bacterium]
MTQPLKVIISGGGTGGHVFPAISIAQELRKQVPDARILFVGAENRLEMTKVPAAGFEIQGLPVEGLDRRHLLKNIRVVVNLLKSLKMARRIIRRFNPDVVVGVGGYASGPVVKVAGWEKIPVLIQEQNSYAGITNRWLSRQADVICVAYKEMNRYFPGEKIVFTGNPVREEIRRIPFGAAKIRKKLNIPDNYKTILILGGSLGAGSVNTAILQKLSAVKNKPLFVIWQTGKNDYEKIATAVDQNVFPNVFITPFIEEMNEAFAVADLIISRSGAGTISELAVIGKPVILVPSPNVAEDHQTKNAKALVACNAAMLIADNHLEEKLMPEILSLLNDDRRMQELSSNIKKMAIPDASSRIIYELLKLVETKKKGE